MSIVELFLVAVGLSADAFAVSLGDGFSLKERKKGVFIAFMFGLFQALMPIAGYFLGAAFAEFISTIDHYIALVVLGFIGGKMIFESIKELKEHKSEAEQKNLSFPTILLQAVATSIDALMVGVSFAAIGVNIFWAAAFIGVITFALSLVGVFGGRKFGLLLGAKAGIIGGAVLVVIGVKTFLEHILGL